LRAKEEEHDYRYFPEGDLVPLSLSKAYVDAVRAVMPELPDVRRDRFVRVYRIPVYDATVLTSDKGLADFFEECMKLIDRPKEVSNWIMTDLQRWLHEQDIEITEAKILPTGMVRMLQLIEKGVISGKIAKTVLREMVRSGKGPEEIVDEQGLVRIFSEREIELLVEKVFEDNPKAVQDAVVDEKAANYLVGKLMEKTRGRADPGLANAVIRKMLKELRMKG
jgi:aspartyl-tRNA(Asn)/glutamyl-tRNA(Gln) amidotransferase subunit B